jgi:hypothetical protein
MPALVRSLLAAAALVPFGWLHPTPAPAGWKRLPLPSGAAVLWYPASLHPIAGDPGTVSVAELDHDGDVVAYLNVTPRQGRETIADWPAFRLDHQRDEMVPSSIHALGRVTNRAFRTGRGSCVIDEYATVEKHHRFREIACFVQGRTSSSVIVAATTPTLWSRIARLLERAIDAFQVR